MIYLDFAKNKGIYQAIFDLPNVKLNIVNDVIPIDYLDNSFMFHNGHKCVVDNLKDVTDAAKIIITENYTKWQNYINGVLQADSLSAGTITTQKTTGQNTAKNQISAYDSNDLVNDGQTTQDNTITSETKVTNLDDLNKLINLYQSKQVYDIINSDIRNVLFQNIY